MNDELRRRVADALGWTVEQTQGFSVPSLRELVRRKHPDLALEIDGVVQRGDHVLGERVVVDEVLFSDDARRYGRGGRS